MLLVHLMNLVTCLFVISNSVQFSMRGQQFMEVAAAAAVS
jgi:hypothetical protein